MQALGPVTIFPCYAPEDRELAARLAVFLENAADVRVLLMEGEIQPGQDLAAKAREAQTADVAVVLFSRASLPSRWARAEWQGPLVDEPAAGGTRIAFARCDDCNPPRVLSPIFDVTGGSLKGMRRLKRWVMGREGEHALPAEPRLPGHEGELELIAIAVADRPGVDGVESVGLAYEFATAYGEDFDAVLRLECGRRRLVELAGDLGVQLGAALEGDLEENLKRLCEVCESRRLLLLLEDPDEETVGRLRFRGRCSTLVVAEAGPDGTLNDPVRASQRTLARIDPEERWSEYCRVARMAVRRTRERKRLAECFDILSRWHDAARREDDRAALEESAREMVWILESWGRTEEAGRLEVRRATEYEEQMLLF